MLILVTALEFFSRVLLTSVIRIASLDELERPRPNITCIG
jgi:hypothetical protein